MVKRLACFAKSTLLLLAIVCVGCTPAVDEEELAQTEPDDWDREWAAQLPPLHGAALLGDVAKVKELLEGGADVNAQLAEALFPSYDKNWPVVSAERTPLSIAYGEAPMTTQRAGIPAESRVGRLRCRRAHGTRIAAAIE